MKQILFVSSIHGSDTALTCQGWSTSELRHVPCKLSQTSLAIVIPSRSEHSRLRISPWQCSRHIDLVWASTLVLAVMRLLQPMADVSALQTIFQSSHLIISSPPVRSSKNGRPTEPSKVCFIALCQSDGDHSSGFQTWLVFPRRTTLPGL